jgi:hypothetical protein
MKNTGVVCTLAIVGALACHSKPAPGAHWRRVSESAEPLQNARGACKAEALDATRATQGQDLAAKAAVGVFTDCMRKRGWVLVEDAD